jgi:hypothetical protein
MKQKQISFDFIKDCKKEYGGSLLVSKRKAKRPLSTKQPVHLILRGECPKLFSPGNHKLEFQLVKLAAKYGIKIYHKSFNWTHFHALILIPSRHSYNSFIKTWTAEITKIRGRRGAFKLRPFTRVGTWGEDFKNLKRYQDKNNREAWGLTQSQFEFIESRLAQSD